jgi:hypothetical protein
VSSKESVRSRTHALKPHRKPSANSSLALRSFIAPCILIGVVDASALRTMLCSNHGHFVQPNLQCTPFDEVMSISCIGRYFETDGKSQMYITASTTSCHFSRRENTSSCISHFFLIELFDNTLPLSLTHQSPLSSFCSVLVSPIKLLLGSITISPPPNQFPSFFQYSSTSSPGPLR